MLNPFPILFLAPIAYLLLRVCVGVILWHLARRHFHDRQVLAPRFVFSVFPFGMFAVWWLIAFEIIIGGMLVIGAQTQIAALLTLIMAIKCIMLHKRFSGTSVPPRLFYVLLAGTALSLFITGAGGLALDLPI